MGLEFLRPQWPCPEQVQSLVTTRFGGVSESPYSSLNLGDHVGDLLDHVKANRALLKEHLPTEPIWLKQVHGTIVSTPKDRVLVADAIVTNIPNEVLAIMTADCLPVLFSNNAGSVIGAAHAGWRGLSAGVLENTVKEMKKLTKDDDDNIVAWLGPSIGPNAFEVGQDVVDAFQATGIVYSEDVFKAIASKPGKYLADLYELARGHLKSVGVDEVYGGNHCTVTQADQFFSYRRDGVTGRFTNLIWIS
ncbi:peptidoglycan editing factor PgeF [Polynucleobacter sp. TSB-Sco08W16]|uniref:peptidoglycan editing factor PgeF n=1 Tax=Polynucleobacter sp. TSB-Sco08W16 TaxID=1758374 RepID=UPI001BFCE028|nr:peptidoglycan editing factor PgeF [Polynucleobacter sp. TSB-Sco08W16]QWD73421.1 peptidoglycan editing factor PgeF [Polynucleobacter sp. TSB-Sco08W16]